MDRWLDGKIDFNWSWELAISTDSPEARLHPLKALLHCGTKQSASGAMLQWYPHLGGLGLGGLGEGGLGLGGLGLGGLGLGGLGEGGLGLRIARKEAKVSRR